MTPELESALASQTEALEAARDATVAFRKGKLTQAERKAAMIRLEEADARVAAVRRSQIQQAAQVLGGEIVGEEESSGAHV